MQQMHNFTPTKRSLTSQSQGLYRSERSRAGLSTYLFVAVLRAPTELVAILTGVDKAAGGCSYTRLSVTRLGQQLSGLRRVHARLRQTNEAAGVCAVWAPMIRFCKIHPRRCSLFCTCLNHTLSFFGRFVNQALLSKRTMDSSGSSDRLVVGIDFGTTFSGYASSTAVTFSLQLILLSNTVSLRRIPGKLRPQRMKSRQVKHTMLAIDTNYAL